MTSSGKALHWSIKYMQAHGPGGELCNLNASVVMKDRIVAAQASFKILSVSITNRGAVFWRLISL